MEEKTLEKIEEGSEKVIETMPGNSVGETFIYAGGCAAIATMIGIAIHFVSKKIRKIKIDDIEAEKEKTEDDYDGDFDGDTIIE